MASKGHTIFTIIFFLYLAGVAYLCFGHFEDTPSLSLQFLGIPTDKLVHATMFFPFPILAFLAFDRFTGTVPQTLRFAGGCLLIGLMMAAGTEYGQALLTDHRSGDPWDFLADSIGLVLSSIIVSVWYIRKQKR